VIIDGRMLQLSTAVRRTKGAMGEMPYRWLMALIVTLAQSKSRSPRRPLSPQPSSHTFCALFALIVGFAFGP
jgi:hypothetical protein